MDSREAFDRGYRHKNLPFWLGLISAPGLQIRPEHNVLDVGCGTGLFLQMLFDEAPFQSGVGIDIDPTIVESAINSLRRRGENYPISYECAALHDFKRPNGSFDVAFCQEVFWMVEDLAKFAENLHAVLADRGTCYATAGVHSDNPLWKSERAASLRDGNPAFVRSIDELADIFSAAGFSVGVRPLPTVGYVMHAPEASVELEQRKSLYSVAKSSFQEKMLFAFYKGHNVKISRSIKE